MGMEGCWWGWRGRNSGGGVQAVESGDRRVCELTQCIPIMFKGTSSFGICFYISDIVRFLPPGMCGGLQEMDHSGQVVNCRCSTNGVITRIY